MQLPLLKNADVKGKTVFLRADLDVPLVNGRIEDDTRLLAAIPTIEYLLKNNAKIIIAGHLGRPKGIDKSLSLEPVAHWFSIKYKALSIKQGKRGEFDGWEIGLNIFLLENLRFYEGEEKNDPEFVKKLASLAEIYVNDAFTTSHRNHASIVGVPAFLPHFAGFHLEKEITNLSKAMENPKRPMVVVIGGVKVETKLPLIEKMLTIADFVLVGGKIAQEPEVKKIQNAKLFVASLTDDGNDISPESIGKFIDIINKAEMIVWNGPLGLIKADNIDTEKGTREIAKAITKSNAYKIVGGGDTLDYLRQLGIIAQFDFVSIGGGAMLSFLSGEKLPGIEALLQ